MRSRHRLMGVDGEAWAENPGRAGARRLAGVAAHLVEGLERRLFLSTTVGFQAQQTFGAGAGPYSVATADVNGDGRADVVVADGYGANVSVLLGNGNGSFAAPQNFPVGAYPSCVAVSDLNGDGKMDLVVANSGSSVSVLLGNGTGAFGPAQLVLTRTGASFVTTSDVNGDGRVDLIVVNNTGTFGSSVSVLLGNANATYQIQKTFATGSSPFAAAASDVNGDGKPDLLVANNGDGNVGVMIGNGNGSFHALAAVAAGPGPESVAVSDMNGDGRRDLVVGNYNGGTLSVALGIGNGTFQPQQTFDAGSTPRSAVIADFNGDGKPDVLVANYYTNSVSVLVGGGDGTLAARKSFAASSQPWSVAATDLNRDGRLDVIVANRGSGTVGAFVAVPPPTVVSINRAIPPGPSTVDSSVHYVVTFSAPVTGVDYTDFVLAKTGTVNATNFFIVTGGPTVYTVVVYDISGAGTLGLNLVADGTIQDALGNAVESGIASFQSQQTVAAGSGMDAVAISDVNGDGKPDMVVSNGGQYSKTNTISVLLGNGNGTFKARQTFGTGPDPTGVAVSDFNGDGNPDIVASDEGSSYYTPSTVSVLLGNGDGTFKARQTFGVGSIPWAVVAVDVNGDAKADVVVANKGGQFTPGNTLSVLLGNGDGTFKAQQTLGTGSSPTSLAVADVNGDGRPDVVATYTNGRYSPADVSVLLGNGNGTFKPQLTFVGGAYAVSVAISDVNGDGKPDLAVVSLQHSYSFAGGFLGVLLGNGDGTFKAEQTFDVGAQPDGVVAFDMNGDGKPDLAVINYGQSSVNVLLGNGNGGFQARQGFAAGYGVASVAAGDVNGDGKSDLVTGNYGDSTVSVLIGAPTGVFTAVGQVYTIAPPADVINGSSLNDGITLTRDLNGTDIDWTLGAASGQLPVGDPNGLTVNGGGGVDTITLNYVNGSPLPGAIHLNGTFQISGIQSTDPLVGTTLEIGRSTVYVIYGGPALDPVARIRAYLANGFNGGAWNGVAGAGTGVVTSTDAKNNPLHNTGVGWADSSDGTGVNSAANTIELKYTVNGDANLDRVVNSVDAIQMARNYLIAGKSAWDLGNFNYDSAIDFSDAQILQKNFNAVATGSVVAATTAKAVNAGVKSSGGGTLMVPVASDAGGTAAGGGDLTGGVVEGSHHKPRRHGKELRRR